MSTVEPLNVHAVNMFEKENAMQHYTYRYELVYDQQPSAVFRRGQPFQMAVDFDRPYSEATDIVRLVFSFGQRSNTINGTRAIINVKNNGTYQSGSRTWGIRRLSSGKAGLHVEIWSPVDSPVGVWTLEIRTSVQDQKLPVCTYGVATVIYLLFNPWVKGDLVHMEDPEEVLLEEYVCNDAGKIWMGEWRNPQGTLWFFGQFAAPILPACQYLLNLSGIKVTDRGDPVKMTRAIARIVNSNNGGGVLMGQWGDVDYSKGTHPLHWTGSVPILKQFLESGRPVRYGQCWVFAGVVTTVCRALGIPSRVVTNFISAHDADDSLSIDRFFTREGFEFGGSADSWWNFHVWNDVWMSRLDLPSGYDGWQAIDATPQEQSDGTFQCGPSSHRAIREGAIGYNHDVPFLLAAVNADIIDWIETPESELGWVKLRSLSSEIGRMILTQKPGSSFDPDGVLDKEEITAHYKYQEGSSLERICLFRAVGSSARAMRFYEDHDPAEETVVRSLLGPSAVETVLNISSIDVEFELVDIGKVNIGDNFTATIRITNKSDELRTIDAVLSAESVFYNGVGYHSIKSHSGIVTVAPGTAEEFELHVTVDEYLDKLVEYAMIKLYAFATIKETKQSWANEDNFQIVKPTFKFEFGVQPYLVGEPMIIWLSFKNPLNKTLTECQLEYISPGLGVEEVISLENVGPNEILRKQLELPSSKVGKHWISARFTSTQLTNIRGTARTEICENA